MPHCHPQLKSYSKDIDRWSLGNNLPHNQTLLTLNVTGPSRQTKLPTELPARPPFVGNFLNKTRQDIQRRFVIEADPSLGLNRDKFSTSTFYRYICIWM